MQPLDIGVCSWSLQIPDLDQCLFTIRNELDLNVVQLGWWDDGYRETDRVLSLVEKHGMTVSATCAGFEGEDYATIARIAETGGFKPDTTWDERFAKMVELADLTVLLKTELLAVHIGFVPHDKNDPQYAVMVDRLKRITDALGERGVTLVMETGQEKAEDLLTFIAAVGRGNIAVNFDPANMILYGVGEPAEAVQLLKDKIVHVHMKDATWSSKPGDEWGAEVVLGTGEADIPRIVSKLRSNGYTGPLVIEREAGDDRIGDIKEAINLLRDMVG
jgi:sugar phosphate isomerase/epimerase